VTLSCSHHCDMIRRCCRHLRSCLFRNPCRRPMQIRRRAHSWGSGARLQLLQGLPCLLDAIRHHQVPPETLQLHIARTEPSVSDSNGRVSQTNATWRAEKSFLPLERAIHSRSIHQLHALPSEPAQLFGWEAFETSHPGEQPPRHVRSVIDSSNA
jgi:hypothetical protein